MKTHLPTRRQFIESSLLAAASTCVPAHAATPPSFGKAKSVIQIWLWGGSCHLDTFDPKPAAGPAYCGSLIKPLATKTDGLQVCELLPLLAGQSDKYAIIRSMTHGINNHETAAYFVQTGHTAGRIVFPSLGAVVSVFKGEVLKDTGLPPYVVLTEAQGRFSETGCLGSRYKPFITGGDPNQPIFAVEGIVAEGVTPQRAAQREALRHQLDTLGNQIPSQASFARCEQARQQAFTTINGPAGKVFNLSQETKEVRDRYGRNSFGQSCLIARRLVENGVPFVTINYKGWDTHKQHFETMQKKLPELDAGLSNLIADLHASGLLDSTIVWCGGEFGRTPKVQYDAPWNGGRSHHGACFSALLAGGGFRGGTVLGATDATGSEVADRPVLPQDLLGSICMNLGIDPDAALPNNVAPGALVMPVAVDSINIKTKGRLHEIM